MATLNLMHEKMHRLVALAGGRIDAVFYCPHTAEMNCECRKPKPGLLIAAAKRWNLDLPSGFMIGDRWSDVVAAQAAGCRGVLFETPFSQAERCTPSFRTTEINAAVDWILETATREKNSKEDDRETFR